ncbi:MAG: hypothetical protein UW80_C0041G0001 [Microgenomates group bacterium GW2011_GWC1_44_9]|nr:MAG: hypothetical protein UW80_C0041G0001 [Microgenomates group bacterium GW2011_GWC1_44_9]
MAIQQHPLPQDISSYRFRLIGDMTIKQFASLGISIVVAIIFYSSPLPFFFKYPLSFFFLLLGVGMAFIPVQGRTLDVWIINFIRSIYSPTQYIWKQTAAADITSDTAAPTNAANLQTAPVVSNAKMEISTGKVTPLAVTVTTQPSVPATPSVSVTTPPSTPTAPSPIAAVSQPPSTPPETLTTAVPTPAPVPSVPVAPVSAAPVSQLPVPFTPTTPNTLVGLTITTDNKILDGVLVEIQKNGLTSRATKSNKLGQFMFARPLENGLYQILAEKEGHVFDPYSLELKGDIIRPLKIQEK